MSAYKVFGDITHTRIPEPREVTVFQVWIYKARHNEGVAYRAFGVPVRIELFERREVEADYVMPDYAIGVLKDFKALGNAEIVGAVVSAGVQVSSDYVFYYEGVQGRCGVEQTICFNVKYEGH